MIRWALILCAPLVAQELTLTNADVVRMVQQHKPVEEVLQSIEATSPNYHLTPADTDWMMRAGVSEDVIKAMAARQHGHQDDAPVVQSQAVLPDPKPEIANPWFLRTGHPELWFQIGADFGENKLGGPLWAWTGGTGVAVGLSRYLAVVGEYNYTRDHGADALRLISVGHANHDYLAGIRIAPPKPYSPYFIAGGGLVHRTATATVLDSSANFSGDKAAFMVGFGVNRAVNQHAGLQADFRAIKPTEWQWYARVTGGFYVRF